MRSLLVGLLLSTSIPLCHAGMEGRIDRFVQTEMERQHIPGVALGVLKDGEVLVAKGYGDRLDLVSRREMGDDVGYLYLARYSGRTLEVAFGVGPGGKISHFSLRPSERR